MDNTKSNGFDLNEIVDVENYLIPALKENETNKKKQNTFVLFLITIILFFSSKIISVKIDEIVVLIAVLLFHEFGHFIMMKLMKYSDVKMFFIPFIGAAVSGKNKNDSIIKSCIVSLMGPLPGVIFSIILFFIFGLTHQYIYYKCLEVMLFLNIFNLLPILPLDGGKYIETLFIDNLIMRSVFSIFSIIIFLILSIAFKDIVFIIVSAFSIFSFFRNVKIWRIGANLKKKGIISSSYLELLEKKEIIMDITNSIYKIKPKIFSPKIDINSIQSYFSEIYNIIKYKNTKVIAKLLLFFGYSTVFIISITIALIFVFLNYNEKLIIKNVDGKNIKISQSYGFGILGTEIPINDHDYFDGKGISYFSYPENNVDIESEFYYSNGFRTGLWIEYDKYGKIIKKEEYAHGKLLRISKLKNDVWSTVEYSELPVNQKIYEFSRQIFQPKKSLHSKFSQ
jgi:Zn-dependent protease